MVSTAQTRVAKFVDEHDLDAPPAYRLLDAVGEVGEVAAAMNESTAYGTATDEAVVPDDEIGDALFSILAFADALGIDAGDALDESLAKYEWRLDDRGTAGSA